MQSQKTDKVRIFALARELGMESKDLLTLCQQHGLDIKNQLSTIDVDMRDRILDLVKSGPGQSPQPPQPPVKSAPPAPPPTRRMVDLDHRSRTAAPRQEAGRPSAPVSPPSEPEVPAPAVAKKEPESVAAAQTPVAPSPTPAKVEPTPAVETPAASAGLSKAATAEAPLVSPPKTVPSVPVIPSPQAPTVSESSDTLKATALKPTTPEVPQTPKKSVVVAPSSTVLTPTAAIPEPIPTGPAVVSSTEKQTISETKAPAAPGKTQAPPTQTAPAVRPVEPAEPPAPTITAVPQAPQGRPSEPQRPAAAATQQPTRPAGQPSQGEGQRPATPAGSVPTRNRPPMRNLSAPRPGGQGGPSGGGGSGGKPTPAGSGQGGSPQQGERRPQQGGGNRPVTGQRPGGFRPSPASGITPPSGQQGGNRPVPQRQDEKKPTSPTGARKLGEIPPELLATLQGRDTPPSVKEIEERIREKQQGTPRPGAGPQPAAPVVDDMEDDDDRRGKAKRGGGGPTSAVPGRAERHKERSERQAKRKTGTEEIRGGKISTLLLDDDSPRHRKDPRKKQPKPQGTVERKGKVPITLPITVRTLSEAIGRKSGEVLFKLLGHGLPPTTNINSSIDAEVAELIAIEFGKELEIKKQADAEQDLLDSHKLPDNPEDMTQRAPIVAVMGHVDHGKTSLLDRLREQYGIRSDVVSTEAGGITQVLRAWRVEKDGKPITFLDTPGHEAFTKMRARGANVTDIAVIVVAANDGVMPQTEEAISHAKAAEVSIVVAINKVDLPDANLRKTEQQLYGLGLIPDNMGGDVPFVYTSAKSGKGIDEMLEQISVVAELKELKANPKKPAQGTCLEAYLSEKEGVQATLLVQDGTLRPGDVVLCGATYGTVRKMFDDMGNVIDEAGPSVPVRILGLDDVPNADDAFHVVPNLTTAREIAEERKGKLQERTQRAPTRITLETLKDAHIAELKIILKAEARGSIEAIRNELEKLHHEEVRVRILHAAIGGINASDVQLALTSPEDTLIVGFNVVPDNEAKALAEERGIQIREYDIIYKLADDIRSALEGKLKPREEVIQLGRAIVRETFKISRVGTIAGCFVTQGTLERSGKIRVIRSGVVVYPPADRSVGLESLKRYKDDVREVREGFECGLKIAGYDDIKVDDVIECYKVEQVQRSLS